MIYLKNNKILTCNGKLRTSCCDTGNGICVGDECIGSDCNYCTSGQTPKYVKVTVSGLNVYNDYCCCNESGGSCSIWSGLLDPNTTFICEQTANPCIWASEDIIQNITLTSYTGGEDGLGCDGDTNTYNLNEHFQVYVYKYSDGTVQAQLTCGYGISIDMDIAMTPSSGCVNGSGVGTDLDGYGCSSGVDGIATFLVEELW